jgi:hypothetical protein
MTGGPGRDHFRAGNETGPGRHRGLDGPNVNVPGGKLTGLVVTRPGEPEDKEKMS